MYVTYTRIYGWSDYGGESSYQPGYRLENMMWMTLLVYDYIIPGDELESAALEVFLKYTEFALSYSDCLEKAIETLQSDSGTPENSAIISEDVYEKIQCVVKESFPYIFN